MPSLVRRRFFTYGLKLVCLEHFHPGLTAICSSRHLQLERASGTTSSQSELSLCQQDDCLRGSVLASGVTPCLQSKASLWTADEMTLPTGTSPTICFGCIQSHTFGGQGLILHPGVTQRPREETSSFEGEDTGILAASRRVLRGPVFTTVFTKGTKLCTTGVCDHDPHGSPCFAPI